MVVAQPRLDELEKDVRSGDRGATVEIRGNSLIRLARIAKRENRSISSVLEDAIRLQDWAVRNRNEGRVIVAKDTASGKQYVPSRHD